MSHDEGKTELPPDRIPPLKPLFKPVVTTAEEHRRQHGMGRLSVLDTDAELAAFAAECLVTMTFPQTAAAIAAHFPPGRRSSSSGLNRWWHRQRRLASIAGS